MSNVSIGCTREQSEDGSWTITITAAGLTADEANELADLTEKPFQAALHEATAARGFDTKFDHVTGEKTPLKSETRQ